MPTDRHQIYIDGSWRDPASGTTYGIPNPATEEIVAQAPDGTVADVESAVAAARRAFDEGPWRKTTVEDRARVLERLAELLTERKDELRELLVAAGGAEANTHVVQIETPIFALHAYAEQARRFPFEEMLPSLTVPTRDGMIEIQGMTVRQPVGVCGLIPTWNFPLWVTLQKLAPALATGCTVVIKPSPYLPLVDLMVAELLEQCDLPPGVVNVVSGQSPQLGQALVSHPGVDKVSFTGAVSTGKAIMRAASDSLKRVHLELGGKSALIILDDMPIAEAARTAATPTYFHAGQGCALATRVLVPRAQHDALVEAMVEYVRTRVKIGDPVDPKVKLGPLIRPERRDAVEALIQSGLEERATLATGGGRPDNLERGWFIEPTIFANVENHMRIAREEFFGPVVSVMPYDDDAHAVRIANDSELGLFGGILARDVERAKNLARALRTGGVSINQGVNLLHAPFGGFKQSGIGREGGSYGLHEMTETQAITWI